MGGTRDTPYRSGPLSAGDRTELPIDQGCAMLTPPWHIVVQWGVWPDRDARRASRGFSLNLHSVVWVT